MGTGSSPSVRSPPTREDQDTKPPPLPPKDNPMTQSLPIRPVLTSTALRTEDPSTGLALIH